MNNIKSNVFILEKDKDNHTANALVFHPMAHNPSFIL